MSPSDTGQRISVAAVEPCDPLEAFRESLFDLAAAIVRAGASPAGLVRVEIRSREAGVFHLSRRPMDLAWRDAFGGLRPPIRYSTSDRLLEIVADLTPAAPVREDIVWRGMTRDDLARAYSPRRQADMRVIFARWNREGAEARRTTSALDLAYGPARDECLDVYPARAGRAPLWVFLHGGYWQACTKDQHGQFGEGMRANGFAVAHVDYGLAPDTPLVEIVAQVRRALGFLVAGADALGVDPARIHLAGHSAGAQLAALLAADPDAPPIRSALLLSGVFDLAPIAHLPMGPMLGLDDEATVDRLSPLRRPRPAARIGIALGDLETDEFKRQSADMSAAWGASPPLVVAGRHHFNLLEDLRGPSALLDLALATACD